MPNAWGGISDSLRNLSGDLANVADRRRQRELEDEQRERQKVLDQRALEQHLMAQAQEARSVEDRERARQLENVERHDMGIRRGAPSVTPTNIFDQRTPFARPPQAEMPRRDPNAVDIGGGETYNRSLSVAAREKADEISASTAKDIQKRQAVDALSASQGTDGALVDAYMAGVVPGDKLLKPEPKDPIEGTDAWNKVQTTLTDNDIRKIRAQNEGRTGPGSGGSSPIQAKTEAMFEVANHAYGTLKQVIADEYTKKSGKMRGPGFLAQTGSQVPIIGNWLAGEGKQKLDQATYQLGQPYLTWVSGAAVPETEVVRFMKAFIPIGGDADGSIRNKLSGLETLMSAFGNAAGGDRGSSAEGKAWLQSRAATDPLAAEALNILLKAEAGLYSKDPMGTGGGGGLDFSRYER